MRIRVWVRNRIRVGIRKTEDLEFFMQWCTHRYTHRGTETGSSGERDWDLRANENDVKMGGVTKSK